MKLIQTIATIAITTGFASADLEKEVRLDDCPAPVRETLVENSREGKIDDIDLITIGDKQIYIAEVDLPRDIDLKVFVSGDGALVKTREDVRSSEIPAFIGEAVRDFGGKIDDVEKETVGETVTYHVSIDRSGQPDLDAVISSDGKVISKTEEIDD